MDMVIEDTADRVVGMEGADTVVAEAEVAVLAAEEAGGSRLKNRAIERQPKSKWAEDRRVGHGVAKSVKNLHG